MKPSTDRWVCSECRQGNHVHCKRVRAWDTCICQCLGLPAEQAEEDRFAYKVTLIPIVVLILAIIANLLLR